VSYNPDSSSILTKRYRPSDCYEINVYYYTNGIKAGQTSFQQYTCKAIATFVSKKQFDTLIYYNKTAI